MEKNISAFSVVKNTNTDKLILAVYVIGLVFGRILRPLKLVRAYGTHAAFGLLVYLDLKAVPIIPSANAKEVTVPKVDQRGREAFDRSCVLIGDVIKIGKVKEEYGVG